METATDLGHPIASKNHIKVLLRRRDHLKKIAFARLLKGQEASFDLAEISAINSVVNELLTLRAAKSEAAAKDEQPPDADEAEPDRFAIEVDTLATEEVMAMIAPVKKVSINVKQMKRIRFLPHAELRIARTTSVTMDVVNVGLWKMKGENNEWRSSGGFRIPLEGFSALVQELINLEI